MGLNVEDVIVRLDPAERRKVEECATELIADLRAVRAQTPSCFRGCTTVCEGLCGSDRTTPPKSVEPIAANGRVGGVVYRAPPARPAENIVADREKIQRSQGKTHSQDGSRDRGFSM